MTHTEIHELERNASAIVAEAAGGTPLTITDGGRPVAQLIPLAGSVLERLVAVGLLRRASRRLSDLPAPQPGPAVSLLLAEMREEERF